MFTLRSPLAYPSVDNFILQTELEIDEPFFRATPRLVSEDLGAKEVFLFLFILLLSCTLFGALENEDFPITWLVACINLRCAP